MVGHATWHATWLWPDHAIGKLGSRHLRDMHNALVNEYVELVATLQDTLTELEDADIHGYDSEHRGRLAGQRVNIVRALDRAKGGPS